jgi:hypothetical protein
MSCLRFREGYEGDRVDCLRLLSEGRASGTRQSRIATILSLTFEQ